MTEATCLTLEDFNASMKTVGYDIFDLWQPCLETFCYKDFICDIRSMDDSYGVFATHNPFTLHGSSDTVLFHQFRHRESARIFFLKVVEDYIRNVKE